MRTFSSLNQVQAEKISHVMPLEGNSGVEVIAGAPFVLPPEAVSRYLPKMGDYLIAETDGTFRVIGCDEFEALYCDVTSKRVSYGRIQFLLDNLTFDVIRVADSTTMMALASLPNGFSVAIGQSACVDPLQFDFDEGKKWAIADAKEKAKNELWKLEGYCLKQRIEPF